MAVVTPYVGVWIETLTVGLAGEISKSLLMWECGLKPAISFCLLVMYVVTPYVGVWIETP